MIAVIGHARPELSAGLSPQSPQCGVQSEYSTPLGESSAPSDSSLLAKPAPLTDTYPHCYTWHQRPIRRPKLLKIGLRRGMKRAHYDISDRVPSPQMQDGSDHMIDTSNGATRGVSKRLPKVSKKIQACTYWCSYSTEPTWQVPANSEYQLRAVSGTECQRRKIKCDLKEGGETICSRCRKRGFQCVVNKNLQSILEDDGE